MDEQTPPDQTQEELIDAAANHVPDLRGRVERGEVYVLPGKTREKPVVKKTADNSYVKGTGQAPSTKPLDVVARENSWLSSKEGRSARKALEDALPAEGTPEQRGTLPWLVEQALQMIDGDWGMTACPSCKHEFRVPGMKRDARVLLGLLDQRIGKAPAKLEINEKSERLVAVLEGRVPVEAIKMREVSEHDAEEMRVRAIASGLVDPQWEDDADA